MHFDIIMGKGLGNNALKSGLEEARYRQTPQEHEQLLDISNLPDYPEYLAMPPGPGKTLMLAKLQAEAQFREHEAPKYWDEQTPRRQVTQSDAWVRGIDYDPYSNFMQYHTERHSYARPGMSPSDVGDTVSAPDIGKRLLGRG